MTGCADKIQDSYFCRNGRFFLRLLASSLFLFILFCAPASAFEAFLFIGYSDSGRVYRITTSDENQFPVGYAFAAGPAEGFFVDQLKNFRLLKSSPAVTFKPVTDYIYRQVFDGNGFAADWGYGHAQYQDQRNLINPDGSGRPVFRPTGAPFSAGPGELVADDIAMSSLQKGECEIVNSKKWYRIPNGSWYQTWFTCEGKERLSYKIYYDVWETGESACLESLWRGYTPGKVLERIAAISVDKRFRRSQVDGAMELINRNSEVADLTCPGGKSSFHIPAPQAGEGNLYVYSWTGEEVGTFFLNGQRCDEHPVFESQAANIRFAGCGFAPEGTHRLYVMGTDVLRSWLQATGTEAEQAECTQAVFAPFPEVMQTVVFVYSAGQNCIYRFVIDESKSGKVTKPEIINLKFKLASIYADAAGNLYLATVEKRPEAFLKDEDFAAGFETLEYKGLQEQQVKIHDEEEIRKDMQIKRDYSGRLIFSQSSNAVLYVIYAGQSEFNRLGSVFLDKTYFSREFAFKNVSESELSGSATDVLRIAKKPENSLTDCIGDVPGFPDQFREPTNLLISVFQD